MTTSQPLRGDADAPLAPLRGRTVAILGYGNQGRAHAMNLRDSGLAVIVGGRPAEQGVASSSPHIGQGLANARAAGFRVGSLSEAAAAADLIVMALPDEAHAEAYEREIACAAGQGATLGFLHGFSIRYGLLRPRQDLGVVLVAPKGPGTTLRERFVQGQGIPALVGVEREAARRPGQPSSRDLALAWANGIGCARAGLIETTFALETETDLFGEQAVLCGGMTALITAAFETLVEAGYPADLAYIECCHEVKQVADLVYARGLAGMREAISGVAEFGSFEAGPRLVSPALRATLREMLAEIRDGRFAKRVTADHAAGDEWIARARAAARRHSIEAAGESVRALMPWLAAELDPGPKNSPTHP